MFPQFTIESLRALKGAPVSVLLALWLDQTGVDQAYLERNTGYTDKPMKQALAYLREHGYIVKTAQGWKLAGALRQLPLGYTLTNGAGDAVDPAPLQAGVPLDDADGPLTSSRNNSDSPSGVVVLKNLNNESFKTTTTNTSRKNSDSSIEGRRHSAHVAEVAARLARRASGAGPAGDDRLPPELLACAEALVARVHVPRERAELAVAGSTFDASQILEQIDLWLAYRDAPAGANLNPGLFPLLVAARIERGDVCPQDVRGAGELSRYDGLIDQLSDDQEQEP